MHSEKNRRTSSLLPFAICIGLFLAFAALGIYVTCLRQQIKLQGERLTCLEGRFRQLENSKVFQNEHQLGSTDQPWNAEENENFGTRKPQARFVIHKNNIGPSSEVNAEIKLHEKTDLENTQDTDEAQTKEYKDMAFDAKHFLGKTGGRFDEEHVVEKRDLHLTKEQRKELKRQKRRQKLKGEKGDKGDKGDRGPKGPYGKMGPKGEKGEPGMAITTRRAQATELIHLTGNGKLYDMSAAKDSGVVFKRWQTETIVGKLWHSREEGRIHIVVSGYYYVYCQMHYHSKLVFNQHILRKNKGKAMMFGFDTFNNTLTGRKRWSSTNYIGGIHKMLNGDSIHVTGQPTAYLFSPKSSYFGLFLLHELP